MKRTYLIVLAVVMSFSVACKKETKEEPEAPAAEEVQSETEQNNVPAPSGDEYLQLVVNLDSKSESTATGTVTFKEKNGMVSMVAVLSGLTEGTHAIHIHEKADCSSADGKSTGGHWNPTGQPHGKFESETGFHKGDIGNFEANAEGRGTITVATSQWCIGCDDDTKNIVNKAIIVHAGADDFTTQPTGAAGGRVSCGGIIQ